MHPHAGTVSSADLNSPLARKAAAAVAPLFEKARSGYAVAAGSADPYLCVLVHCSSARLLLAAGAPIPCLLHPSLLQVRLPSLELERWRVRDSVGVLQRGRG